jgi:hypothetical protein
MKRFTGIISPTWALVDHGIAIGVAAEALFNGDNGRFYPRVDSQLAQNGLDVELDGTVGNAQLAADNFVALTFCQVAKDLLFAGGKLG